MKAPSVKPVRCAVYTRVSTEHGLDQEFNSLDAQYDAASAYIKSQAHAGWTLIRSRYDDGGYSGGSTDRPDLQRLRITALPTSSDRASSNAPRIVNAWRFGVGMVASEITPCARVFAPKRCTSRDRSATRIGTASPRNFPVLLRRLKLGVDPDRSI